MSLNPLRVLRLNLFLAIKQRLHCSLPRSSFIRIKRLLHPAKHDVQWNSLLLPRLHQRPIHRTQKQVLPAPADECVFDFSEVIEVVQTQLNLPGATALDSVVYDTQAVKREGLVDSINVL